MPDAVLLIDDDVEVLRAVGSTLEQAGYEVARELDLKAGLEAYQRLHPEVVLLDSRLAGSGNDLEALGQLLERNAGVILLADPDGVPLAVGAMQLGAETFLLRPPEREHLLAATARVADKTRLRRVNELLVCRASPGGGLESLGTSGAMRELGRRIALVARNDRTPVLLRGESGVGKSWLAGLLHRLSSRARGPMVVVNCHGHSAAAVEEELFGSERATGQNGAQRAQGLVEIAADGTLFFEELDEVPAEVQPALIRLLETGSFRRAGGTREIPSRVRVIAATARNLDARIESGALREELWYRLNGATLTLPPFRDREREDRLTLLMVLFRELQEGISFAPSAIAPDALERFLVHGWPGNVRELRNVLERVLILGRGQPAILVEQLPGELRARPGPGDRRHTPMTIDELERAHIERTLRHHGGNRTRAAQELGISRATLINKIKRYAIQL